MIRLSDHFSLEELTYSGLASRLGINNIPPPAELVNLTRLAEFLEQVRSLLGNLPLQIHSAYRSPMVNSKVGGVCTSAHLDGRAADFVCPSYGSPFSIAQAIKQSTLVYDQMILEYGWVHIAIPREKEKARLQILTKKDADGPYEPGLRLG